MHDHAHSHTMHITLPGDKATRGRVVYLQPRSERWLPQSVAVHILSHEWMKPDWYVATYYAGKFMPLRYKLVGDDYQYVGSFKVEQCHLPAL